MDPRPQPLTRRVRGDAHGGATVARMSRKHDNGGAPGTLAEIRSFIFTVIVVALGLAFLTALFTGGTGSVQQLINTIFSWLFQLMHNVFDTVTRVVPEPST